MIFLFRSCSEWERKRKLSQFIASQQGIHRMVEIPVYAKEESAIRIKTLPDWWMEKLMGFKEVIVYDEQASLYYRPAFLHQRMSDFDEFCDFTPAELDRRGFFVTKYTASSPTFGLLCEKEQVLTIPVLSFRISQRTARRYAEWEWKELPLISERSGKLK